MEDTGEGLYSLPHHRLQGEVLRNSLGGMCILLTWFCFVYDFLFLLGAGEKGIIFVTILLQSMLDTVPTK
jgi:hypothetical protein